MNIDETADELFEFYGEDPVLPTRTQWHQLLSSGHEGPICMVNFMNFRDTAHYPNRQAFIEVFRNPEYRRNHHHRMAGTLRHGMVVVLE